uniref:C2H2-type domain-containing protein n=1 Tax=Sinocyclocheilus rhinocerous TaxID=307959 RepID=A0A673H179_9TELE
MKSTEVDPGLFTDSYCKVCSAQLISESQRVAHYEVSNAHTHTHVHIKHKHSLIPVNLICCQ